MATQRPMVIPSSPAASGPKVAVSQPSPFAPSTPLPTPPVPHYRPARPLPYELEQTCKIFIEEALYSQSLHLLTGFLSSGLHTADFPNCPPAYVPPPSHLAFISTLSIHPSHNTRTNKPDRIEASNLALQYLRLLQRTVGPINGRLRQAYTFPKNAPRRAGAWNRKSSESSDRSEQESLLTDLASSASLWSQAGDFWAIVGWAFNCTVLHKKRWERWELWLEHMIEVLEDDWTYAANHGSFEDTLILSYLDGMSGSGRRTLRAIFADGTKKSVQEFGEIWKNETQKKREKDIKFEKIKIDIEAGEFGDYFNNSSSEEGEEEEEEGEGEGDDGKFQDRKLEQGSTRPPPNLIDTLMSDSPIIAPTSVTDDTLLFGGSTAILIRTRFLALLSGVAQALPSHFIDISSLSTQLLTHIRPLPLLTFASFLSPVSLAPFPLAISSGLVQYFLRSLQETGVPPAVDDDLTQERLEQSVLPWAANTAGVADNAKVGACVECLVRMFEREVGFEWSPKLEEKVEKGISRREEKAKKIGRRKGEAGTGGGESDALWLKESGERVACVIGLAKMKATR